MRNTCRVCDAPLAIVLDLGPLYVSNFITPDEDPGLPVPLTLARCDNCTLVQLTETVPPDTMYKRYWYKSGTNEMMRAALANVVTEACRVVKLQDNDIVLDIGSNDGTLLSNYPDYVTCLGFEPSNIPDNYPEKNLVINEYFNAYTYRRVYSDRAKIITSIAMFYDLEDPNTFVNNVKECLDQDGVWVIQMAYLHSMLKDNAFDNICHEHLEYYNLTSLKYLLDRHGLVIEDVTFNDVNGGSFRVFVRKEGADIDEIGRKRVERVLKKESEISFERSLQNFADDVQSIRKRTVNFIRSEKAAGKRFLIYGASTKGNTLLQYYGLSNAEFYCAIERDPKKFGRLTVGSNIPIWSEETLAQFPPDYLFVLPWHFISGFKTREKPYLAQGGKFLVPLPMPYILGLDAQGDFTFWDIP